jgi:acyl carrier protein
MNPTETAIHEFLVTELFYDRDLRSLTADEDLLGRGLLDSLGILKVVSFCEERFGVTIPDHDVVPDHLSCVRAIAALVERSRRPG